MALRMLVDYGDEHIDDEDDTSHSPTAGRDAPDEPVSTAPSIQLDLQVELMSRENSEASAQPKPKYGFPHCLELTEEELAAVPTDISPPTSKELDQKYLELLKKQKASVNEQIQKSKSFKNPSIYQKLIEYCRINEFGTNFQPDQFDPNRWTEADSVEELARLQQNATDKALRDAKSGKAQPSVAKRKSRWEEAGAKKPVTTAAALHMQRIAGVNLSKSTK